jgi:hypothetical protein
MNVCDNLVIVEDRQTTINNSETYFIKENRGSQDPVISHLVFNLILKSREKVRTYVKQDKIQNFS